METEVCLNHDPGGSGEDKMWGELIFFYTGKNREKSLKIFPKPETTGLMFNIIQEYVQNILKTFLNKVYSTKLPS